MDQCQEQTIRVYGLSKHLSRFKFRQLLQKYLGSFSNAPWHMHQYIPLEACCFADIVCSSDELCLDLLRMNSMPTAPFVCTADFRVYEIAGDNESKPCLRQPSNELTLLDLNCDCLRLIVERCPLKTQIALAKVCQRLERLVEAIWRKRYSTLQFSVYYFHTVQQLNETELCDFLTIIGQHVRRLLFSTILFFTVIQHCQAESLGNAPRNAKRYLNVHMCRHLQHFERLQYFVVQGKFLADYTVLELARYCTDLRHFELLDPGTNWFVGKHLHRLKRLERLQLLDCECLERRYMRKTCRTLSLKALNVVQCQLMLQAPWLQRLCNYLLHLETLQLTALADAGMLSSMLKLPCLKQLKFYWYNDFVEFEDLLFTQLLQHASSKLCIMHCTNNPVFMENQSQRVFHNNEYLIMRELVTINSATWQWIDCFDVRAKYLAQFTALKRLTFEYCRLFTPQQLCELARACKNLKQIELIGCREQEDDTLLATWKRETLGRGCNLSIEGLALVEVQKLRNRLRPFRTDDRPAFKMTSIECQFR